VLAKIIIQLYTNQAYASQRSQRQTHSCPSVNQAQSQSGREKGG
jgi:hypothetical protein